MLKKFRALISTKDGLHWNEEVTVVYESKDYAIKELMRTYGCKTMDDFARCEIFWENKQEWLNEHKKKREEQIKSNRLQYRKTTKHGKPLAVDVKAKEDGILTAKLTEEGVKYFKKLGILNEDGTLAPPPTFNFKEGENNED